MKSFLASTTAKVIAAVATTAVVTAIGTTVVLVNMGYRTIAVRALNGITSIVNGGKENYAYEGLHLKSGDDVTVNENSDLTLSLDEDKYVYAEPLTHFWIEAEGKKGDTRTKIHLDEGCGLFRIDNKLEGEEYFDVETPNSTMSVRGTVFRVACKKNEFGEYVTTLDVFEGEVATYPVIVNGEKTGEEKIVTPSQRVQIHADEDETFSEFVIDEAGNDVMEINYEEIPQGAALFLGETIDEGRELCIEKNLLYDYTEINECVYDLREEQVPATCTSEGFYYPKCSVCGKIKKEKVPIPVIAHTPVPEEIAAAEEGGAPTIQYKCSMCGQIIPDVIIDENGEIIPATEPTTPEANGEIAPANPAEPGNAPASDKNTSSSSSSSASSSSTAKKVNNTSSSSKSTSSSAKKPTTSSSASSSSAKPATTSTSASSSSSSGTRTSSSSSSSARTSSSSSSSSSSTSPSSDPDSGDTNTTYVVTFTNEDGTLFASQKVDNKDKANVPAFQPTESGTWMYNGRTFDFNTAITKNMKINWKSN